MVGAKVCYGRLDVELVPAWRVDVDECLKSIAPVSRIYSDADLVVVSHHGPLRALASQLAGEAPDKMFSRQWPWGRVHRIELSGARRNGESA